MVLKSHYTFEYSINQSKPCIFSATATTEEEATNYVKDSLKRIFGKEPSYLKLVNKLQF